MQMSKSSSLNNSSAQIVCNISHKIASFCSDWVDEIPTLGPIRDQQSNNIIYMHCALLTAIEEQSGQGRWSVTVFSCLPPGQRATRIFWLKLPRWDWLQMAREIWKQHLDEAAAGLKRRGGMVLIRSINKSQNNTLRQMTSKQYSTRGRIEIDVECQRKYLTAQRDKRIKSLWRDIFLFHCI